MGRFEHGWGNGTNLAKVDNNITLSDLIGVITVIEYWA